MALATRRYTAGLVGGPARQINPITGLPDDGSSEFSSIDSANPYNSGQYIMGQSGVDPTSAGDPNAESPNPGTSYSGPIGGAPDTSGYQPYSYTQPPPNYSGRQFGYEGGRDLAANYANNRNIERNEGDLLSQYFGGQAGQRAGYEQSAQQKGTSLYGQLEQNPGYTSDQANAILGNRAGGGNAYTDLLGQDYGSNYLNAGEQERISGNPYHAGNNAYDPGILDAVNRNAYNSGMGYAQDTADRLNQGYTNLSGGLDVANNPGLRQSAQYASGVDNILGSTNRTVMGAANRADLGMDSQFGSRMYGAAEDPNLAMSGQYGSNLQSAYRNPNLAMSQQFAGDLRSAYSNPELAMSDQYGGELQNAYSNEALGTTDEYGRQAGMTDQEVADTASMGGQAVGAQTRAAIQDLDRAAAAQGNSDPLAVAAMRSQMNDQGLVNNADATVHAQLAARAQQRQAAQGVEGTRLGAQQYQTAAELASLQDVEHTRLGAQQYRTGAAMSGINDIEQTRLGAQQYQTAAEMSGLQDVEHTRLGAEQYRANARMNAAQGVESTRLGANQFQAGLQAQAGTNMGNMSLNATAQREAMRLAALQGQTGMQMSAAGQLGQYAQGNAMYTGDQQQRNVGNYQQYGNAAGMYNQTAQYQSLAAADQAAADRAAMLATNRQSTGLTNQGNQYNRGYQVQNQLSGLQQGIADRTLQGQQSVRDYYTGQQQYQGQQGNQAAANLLTNRAQTQQGVNQATQGSAAWELGNRQSPSLGSSVAKGIIGGALKGATGLFG